jgi:hypothetical protein
MAGRLSSLPHNKSFFSFSELGAFAPSRLRASLSRSNYRRRNSPRDSTAAVKLGDGDAVKVVTCLFCLAFPAGAKFKFRSDLREDFSETA